MNIKTCLLATAASLAMLGTTQAADLPVRKAPMLAPPPVALWSGFYVGADGGVARHDWTFLQLEGGSSNNITFNHPGAIWTDSKTAGLLGVHVGYNWQFGTLVAGVEADYSWLNVQRTVITTNSPNNPSVAGSATTKINQLATFRGRWGLAVDRTMAYFTGGFAVAHVEDAWERDQLLFQFAGDSIVVSPEKTRWGWVAGAGVEHLFTPSLTLRGELLFVDLGREEATAAPTVNFSERNAAFTHKLTIARVGLSYKFDWGPVGAGY
jgi:outer membrane immunogenic protein